MNNKKNIILLVFTIVTILVFVVTSAYAYFATSTKVTNTVNIGASTGSASSLTTYTEGSILVNTTGKMDMALVGNYSYDTANLVVTASNSDVNLTTECYYDIFLEEKGDHYVTSASLGSGKEFTIALSLDDNISKTSPSVYGLSSYKTEDLVNEMQISSINFDSNNLSKFDYEDSTYIAKLSNDSLINNNSLNDQIGKIRIIVPKGSNSNTQTITATVKMYNINNDQSSIANKTYSYNLKVSNGYCSTVDGTSTTIGTVSSSNTKNLYNLVKSYASNAEVDFNENSSTSGTNGVYTTTNTEGNVPVYYYRGNVDNNIIFNNMCWKIVRTTETGGVKLLYNGTPTDGQCTATGEDTTIGASAYNTDSMDNAYAGYMYGGNDYYTDSKYTEKTVSIDSSKIYYYGTSYTFDSDTGLYTLSGTLVSGVWNETNSANFINKYTCLGTSSADTCSTLYLIKSYKSSSTAIVERRMKAISTSYENATSNAHDSTVKTYIDNWFSNNFNSSSINKIEDTIYCNDRSLLESADNINDNYVSHFSIENLSAQGYGINLTNYSSISRSSPYYDKVVSPSLACSQQNDKFTLKDTKTNYNSSLNGNKKLIYPVALLTIDEVVYAGSLYDLDSNNSNYLYNSGVYWIMTPANFTSSSYTGEGIDNWVCYGGMLYGIAVSYSSISYVRPVLSLTHDTLISTTGDGTSTNPYVVS